MPFQGSRQPVCPPAEKNLDLFPLLSNSLIVCLFFKNTHTHWMQMDGVKSSEHGVLCPCSCSSFQNAGLINSRSMAAKLQL